MSSKSIFSTFFTISFTLVVSMKVSFLITVFLSAAFASTSWLYSPVSSKISWFLCKYIKLSCFSFITTFAILFFPLKSTSINTLSFVCAGTISIGVVSIYFSDSLTWVSSNVSNTVRPFSECPPTNPIATAIFSPNLSVPGIPTHIPFL